MRLKTSFKKIGSSIIITYLSIFLLFNPIVFADDEEYEEIKTEEVVELLQASAEAKDIPDINSRAAVVIDRNTHAVLFGKNEDEKRKMASTTKIATCIVVLEKANLKDIVEVSGKAAGTGGSRLGLKKGDKITVNDLLYGLMLCSGNDSAVALAEYVGGSVEGFAELMNKKAEELGLKNTHFVTPHGLDQEEHYTTAYELAILADYGLNIDKFKEIVGTKSYTVTINGYSKTLNNTIELLGNLNGVYGVKTGFTNGANRCLVTSIKRDNLDVICVVLGADTKKYRTKDSIKIIEYTFKNYSVVNIEDKINEEFNKWKEEYKQDVEIIKGKENKVEVNLQEIKFKQYPVKKEEQENIEIIIDARYELKAPISKDKVIGKCIVRIGEEIIQDLDIVLSEEIEKKGVIDYLMQFAREYKMYLENF